MAARDDEPLTNVVDGLAGRAVLLQTETVRFGLVARDDFGVKRVGIEWIGSGSGPAAMAGGAGRAGDSTRGEKKAQLIEPKRFLFFILHTFLGDLDADNRNGSFFLFFTHF